MDAGVLSIGAGSTIRGYEIAGKTGLSIEAYLPRLHPIWPRCLGFHLRLYLVGYAVPEVPLDLLLGAA